MKIFKALIVPISYGLAILDSTEKEINMLKDEIAFLLKNPVTKEDIERIKQRLGELESRIMT